MKIGFIGAGSVTQAFGGHLVNKGAHELLISNRRGPQSLQNHPLILSGAARAVTPAQATEADIVVLSVPWTQVKEVLGSLPPWKGQILIDATNHFETGVPDFRRADLQGKISSQIVQELAPGARVVKALNTVFMEWIKAVPSVDKTVLFLSGDDESANHTVARLLTELGFVAVPLGDLASGGKLQQLDGPLAGKHFAEVG